MASRVPTKPDITHVEVATVAIRNIYPLGLRKWGMRVTVTSDAVPANNVTWVLTKDLSDDNKNNNNNWEEESAGSGSALWGGLWNFAGNANAFPTADVAGKKYVADDDHGLPGVDPDYVASGTWMVSKIAGANAFDEYYYK